MQWKLSHVLLNLEDLHEERVKDGRAALRDRNESEWCPLGKLLRCGSKFEI